MPVGQTCTHRLQGFLVVDLARAPAARFAAHVIVGHDEGVVVHHHALEAGVGAHVLADGLAHEAGVAPGGEGVEQHPEPLPGTEVEGHQVRAQFADRREIADEGVARPQGQDHPQEVLGRLDAQFPGVPGLLVQADAGQAVALDPGLDPHEQFGVDRLGTGVAAEQAPRHGGEQEQGEGRQHQQHRQVDHVLGPQHHAEQVELARAQVEQHGLAAAPFDPGQAIEDQLGQEHHQHADACEISLDGPGIDLRADLGQRLLDLGRSPAPGALAYPARGLPGRVVARRLRFGLRGGVLLHGVLCP